MPAGSNEIDTTTGKLLTGLVEHCRVNHLLLVVVAACSDGKHVTRAALGCNDADRNAYVQIELVRFLQEIQDDRRERTAGN